MGISDLIVRRAVFLDRDGVLNRACGGADGKSHPPSSPEEVEILPGVVDACDALHRAGFLLIVVTNQPDVARGTQRRQVAERINDELRRRVPIDEVRVCYHDDGGGCTCRKPRPGLLVQAGQDLGIDLSNSFMVGDRSTDIEAGRRAGCKTVLIDSEQGASGRPATGEADFEVDSLRNAVEWIIGYSLGSSKAGREA